MLKVLGIIPARLASTRLPRKMLANIAGQPLIYWTWRQVKKAKLLDEIVVATDAKEIYDMVIQFGGRAILTSVEHRSGSDRVAEAARKFTGLKPDIVVNIQGDEPLISPLAVDATVRVLLRDKGALVSTVATFFKKNEAASAPGNVKVVLDRHDNAIYFSRSLLPYPRNKFSKYFKHLGIYGFRAGFLQKYVKMKPTRLELAESLEQLRILENGYKIKVAVGNFESVSVDTRADLIKVRKILKNA